MFLLKLNDQTTLARVDGELLLEVETPVTLSALLDALETSHPVLRRAIRDQITLQRRPFVRFFTCQEDLSHDRPDAALPDAVARHEGSAEMVPA